MAKTPAQTPAPDDETPATGRPAVRRTTQPPTQAPSQPTGQPTVQPTGQPTVQPTEQLPLDSAPVSASTSAAGGATGLDPDSTKAQSVFRRHPLASGITAAVIAVVVVSGLTAWGVGAAVTSSLTSSDVSSSGAMPMATPTTAPQTLNTKGGAATTGRLAFRATIQSMDGNSWTILTKRGKTMTVAITSATQFGTKKAAATAGSFAVGDSVVIVATRGTGTTPTATRVVDASALGGSAATPAPTPTATPNA